MGENMTKLWELQTVDLLQHLLTFVYVGEFRISGKKREMKAILSTKQNVKTICF